MTATGVVFGALRPGFVHEPVPTSDVDSCKCKSCDCALTIHAILELHTGYTGSGGAGDLKGSSELESC